MTRPPGFLLFMYLLFFFFFSETINVYACLFLCLFIVFCLLVYCLLFACLLFACYCFCLLVYFFLFACLLGFFCLLVCWGDCQQLFKKIKNEQTTRVCFFSSPETINVHACLFLCLFSVFVCLFIVYCLLVYCFLFACLLRRLSTVRCSERYADLRSLLCNQASQLEVTSSPDPIFQMAEPGHCPGNLAALKLLMTRLTWKMKCNQRKRSGLLSNSLPVCLPGKGSQ